MPAVGLGNLLAGLSQEPGYKNDEQIDNALRSVLFETPGSAERTPTECFEQPQLSGCFSGIVDLGAIDVQRGRDHGIPSYTQLREALGLGVPELLRSAHRREHRRTSAGAGPSNSPAILKFTSFTDRKGHITSRRGRPRTGAVSGTRGSTLAARLKAIYGSVANLDAFVGMVSEPAVPGSELGPLQTRCGASSSKRCATATASSTPTTPTWPPSRAPTASPTSTRWRSC